MKYDPITQSNIVYLPLTDLVLSKHNPRQTVTDEEVAELADSIRECGLIQNLSGYQPNGADQVEIVAGGRRLRALELLYQEPDYGPFPIPVAVTDDLETAIAWASAENEARADLSPAQSIRAYAQMKKAGKTAMQIASAFAVSEAGVYRMLSLASLPKYIVDGIENGVVSLDAAKLLAACTNKTLVKAGFEALKDEEIHSTYQLKQVLFPETVTKNDCRAELIGEEAYVAAGGKVSKDLFGGDVYFHDLDLLNKLIVTKIDETIAELKEAGWKWAEHPEERIDQWCVEKYCAERLRPIEGALGEDEQAEYDAIEETDWEDETPEQRERLNELQAILEGDYSDEQKAVSGCYVQLGQTGLQIFYGMVLKADLKDAVDAGIVKRAATVEGKKDADPMGISQALKDDLNRSRRLALQTAALGKTDLLLDLLAYQLAEHTIDIGESYYPSAEPFALKVNRVDNAPKTTTEEGRVLQDGIVMDERLVQKVNEWDGPRGETLSLADFQALGKKHRNAVLADRLAAMLAPEVGFLFDALADTTQMNIRNVFTPSANNYFKRVKASILDSIYADLMGEYADSGFPKRKKAEKVATLHGLFNDKAIQVQVASEVLTRVKEWQPIGTRSKG